MIKHLQLSPVVLHRCGLVVTVESYNLRWWVQISASYFNGYPTHILPSLTMFSAFVFCWVRRLYRKTAGWVTRQNAAHCEGKNDISRLRGMLVDNVRWWLASFETRYGTAPDSCFAKGAIVPGLKPWPLSIPLYYACILDFPDLSSTALGMARLYTLMQERCDAICVCITHTSLLSQMHLDGSSKQYGPSMGLNLSRRSSCIRQARTNGLCILRGLSHSSKRQMPPASCMAPWERHGGLEPVCLL
ncbi:hypothetical protein F4677DRAFT_293413 [Hypoxylon crocopeplum]|nr:hypothetical protein F4677DRAFT_293413 [Hypoxylon crocopeplum]